jgi:hypothetical protein
MQFFFRQGAKLRRRCIVLKSRPSDLIGWAVSVKAVALRGRAALPFSERFASATWRFSVILNM